MTERWRCFVAIPLPEEVRRALATSIEGWSGDPAVSGLRWTDPDALHVTLAFLGSVETDAVAGIQAIVSEVAAGHPAQELEVGGLGAFPSAGRARVVWVGATDAGGALRRLAADLRMRLGVEEGSPFRGHLTVARARREPVDLRDWLRTATAPTASIEAARIELMRSHLGRGPARYERLASAELGVPAHV